MVEVGASVETPPAQQPGEKLDFSEKFGCPEQHRVRRKRFPVHGTVGTARAEGPMVGRVEEA